MASPTTQATSIQGILHTLIEYPISLALSKNLPNRLNINDCLSYKETESKKMQWMKFTASKITSLTFFSP